ncbi:MAG: hypothetical protein LBV60_19965 [Streptomyces sp.]|jgi:hypothetical protein|nr:hypothetical protein [Streptomyces sp.]
MSVSRTAARLIAAFVASGALVGAAAMPAMATGHDRATGRSYHVDVRSGHDHDHYGRSDWHHRHHGWYNNRHWDRDWNRGWYHNRPWHRDHGRHHHHHGWYSYR